MTNRNCYLEYKKSRNIQKGKKSLKLYKVTRRELTNVNYSLAPVNNS